MRNLSELKITGSETPASDDDIAQFEEFFGVKFPEDYKIFLKEHNGGHPELDSFDNGEIDAGVNRFYAMEHPAGKEHALIAEDPSGIWWNTIHWGSSLGERCIPFASTSGGDQFFFDFSTDPPCICLCAHDEGFDEDGLFYSDVLTDTFAEFINRLAIDPELT